MNKKILIIPKGMESSEWIETFTITVVKSHVPGSYIQTYFSLIPYDSIAQNFFGVWMCVKWLEQRW